MAVEVRRARPADAGALLPLILEHAAFEKSAATCTVPALRTALAGERLLLVAEQEGELIGYARATVDFSTWTCGPYLHLDCLFVGADHRRARAGAELLEAARCYAQSKFLPELQWQTPEWNEDARRFYVREGASAARKYRFRLAVTGREGEALPG